jgi:hypothetical protein
MDIIINAIWKGHCLNINKKCHFKILIETGTLELLPVILPSQETKNRRIVVLGQPGQKKQDPISKTPNTHTHTHTHTHGWRSDSSGRTPA